MVLELVGRSGNPGPLRRCSGQAAAGAKYVSAWATALRQENNVAHPTKFDRLWFDASGV